MNIGLGFPIYDTFNESKKGRLKLYFKSRISERTNLMSYDETTLFAEIGGYMGLLLGCSLVYIAEGIFTFLIDFLWYYV